MALTISNLAFESSGPRQRATFDLSLDNSYPAGGYPIASADIGVDSIVYLMPAGDTAGFELVYNRGTGKLQVFFSAGLAHVHAQLGLTEVVPVVANVGTYLLITSPLVGQVQVTAGAVPGPFVLLAEGIVPGIGQVTPDYTLGTLTFNAADAVTSCTIRYMSNVTGSAGGGAAAEVPPGTNLSAVTNVETLVYSRNLYFSQT